MLDSESARLQGGPLIAGVGASAGGLDALSDLFAQADPKAPIAWVIVQHLSPDHKSFFADILQRRTQLSVKTAEHLERLQAGTIYVIEPNTQIRVVDGFIETEQWRRHRSAPASSIDTLFQSLAEGHQHNCAVVILSGSGSDGTRGAALVREAGGLVVAQSPDTAAFDSMPHSAIRSGLIDRVLPPKEIAGFLEAVASKRVLTAPPPGDDAVSGIIEHVKQELGLDLQPYKPDGVHRRLSRRMSMRGVENHAQYLRILRQDPVELGHLEGDLLIGVTSFFRDPEAFLELQNQLRAHVQAVRQPEFRVWVVGCSTGEEAYSVAMVLDDVLADEPDHPTMKLFATDLNERALSVAAKGTYSTAQVSSIPSHLLGRYFGRDDAGRYRVRSFLREMMLFSRHDVVREPPFSRLDAIVCRNLLIYLRPGTQAAVIDRFSFGLQSGGLLFLGPSETAPADDWECSHARWRLYRSRGRSSGFVVPTVATPRRPRSRPTRGPMQQLGPLHDALTTGRLAPHIVATPELEVLYRSGDLSGLLSLPQGPISTDLKRMVSADLATVMTMAAQRVLDSDASSVEVAYSEVKDRVGDSELVFDLHVRRLDISGGDQVLIAFFFEGLTTGDGPSLQAAPRISIDAQERIRALEDQLAQSQRHLQATVEELESSNEELQATNEELLASNEELQSVNEELQSLNEELHTVNQEHQAKIDQLVVVRSELEQLLQAIDVGVLRLDQDLSIQRVNGAFAACSAIRPEDVGRPLADLRDWLAGTSILSLCQAALDGGESVTHTGLQGERTMLLTAHPLRASGQARGITLTCTDVSALKNAAAVEARLVTALNVTALPLAVEDAHGVIVFANEAFARGLNREARWLIGASIDDLLEDTETIGALRQDFGARTPAWSGTLPMAFGAGGPVPIALSATPSYDHGHIQGIVWRLLLPGEAVAPTGVRFGFVAWHPDDDKLVLDPRASAILQPYGWSPAPSVTLDMLAASIPLTGMADALRSVAGSERAIEVGGRAAGAAAGVQWRFRAMGESEGAGLAVGVVWEGVP